MKPLWKFVESDLRKVRELVAHHQRDPFFRLRKVQNVDRTHPPISRARFWMAMLGCLLTTQQRAGPHSAVNRFLNLHPFPLRYQTIRGQRDLEAYVLRTIRGFKGIRMGPTIAQRSQLNFDRLESGLWEYFIARFDSLDHKGNKAGERELARAIEMNLVGFGPKQSRNLMQWLGTSRYEIPLDSRVFKWMNQTLSFPALSSAALSNRCRYEDVLDRVQELCAKARVLPCLLDAAIFSSYDQDAWDEASLGAAMLRGA